MRSSFWICLSSVLIATPFLFVRADDPPAEAALITPSQIAAETRASAAAESPADAEDERDRRLKKRKLEIGMIFTGGIIVMGVFLVVVILIYGRRTRRQLAAGRTASAPRDELWYLKQRRDAFSADDSKSEREGDSE